MRPRKYPYSGRRKRQERPADVTLPDLVVLPNVSFRKELIKHVYTVTRYHDGCTIIRFRIPRFLRTYDEQKVEVKLSYEETLKILNSY
ncbi:phage protein [Streptococcus pneumoniae]|nr:phage protein [Streptococcus pneumoniae]